MPGIKVEKKDGQQEDFDRSKVSSGAIKAGASIEQAESIIGQVETWVKTTAVNGVVKSSDIRTKVLELLQSANPEAAAKYGAYRKESE